MKDFEYLDLKSIINSRASYVSIATTDNSGAANIAPCGSMVLKDPGTFFILRGPLNQTYKNLQENPSAVFMAVNMNILKWLKFFLTGKFPGVYGYRIYAELREELEIDQEHVNQAFSRYGLSIKSKGGRKIKNSLQKVLMFSISKIRPIVF